MKYNFSFRQGLQNTSYSKRAVRSGRSAFEFADQLISHLPFSSNSKPEQKATRPAKKHTTAVRGDISSIFGTPQLEIGEERSQQNFPSKMCNPILGLSSFLGSRQRNVTSPITCFHTRMGNFNISFVVENNGRFAHKETLPPG